MGFLFEEDLDGFGCRIIRKARAVLKTASLCVKEGNLEGSEICV